VYRERCGWGVAGPVTLPLAAGLAWVAKTRTGWLRQLNGVVPEATVVVQRGADHKGKRDAMRCAVYHEQCDARGRDRIPLKRAAGDARRRGAPL
jgi:hypothetical protein